MYASSEAKAHERVKARTREEIFDPTDAGDHHVALHEIIDVAPALHGYVDKVYDLPSRNFNSFEEYRRFETKFRGAAPLSSEQK